jgi:PAS domain S-box-containing protein
MKYLPVPDNPDNQNLNKQNLNNQNLNKQTVQQLERELDNIKQRLRESEFSSQIIMESIPHIIWYADATGAINYFNQQWFQITGLEAATYFGYNFLQAIYIEDREYADKTWRQAVKQQQNYEAEFRLIQADGSFVWVLARARPMFNTQGQVIKWVGTYTNIDKLKINKLKEITSETATDIDCEIPKTALRESEERFRATFEKAAVGIAHVGLDGRWLRVNQKVCEIVGYSSEELLQLTFQEITHPDDLQKDLNYVGRLFVGEINYFTMEKRYIRKNGSIVWVEVTPTLLRDENTHEPKYYIAVIEEIEERKKAQDELKKRVEELAQVNIVLARTAGLLGKRNQELDQFAYVASHDLKAPLRAIANLSEWLEEDLADKLPKENKHHLDLLRGRVYRMEALIDGLLEYSRIGRIQHVLESVDVGKLLTEIIDSLSPPKNFIIEVEPGMPVFNTKRLLLSQVFSKLISNAIKHHNATVGHIKISVKDQGKFYEFSVTDDGPGVAPEYYEKIFMIFQTLQARDKKESIGVGLSIVKKILDDEGCYINIESQLNQGTTFTFSWHK